MSGRAEDAGLPGAELRERQREGRIVTLPGIPGYLVQATGGTVPSPAEQPSSLRRKWDHVPARTRRRIAGIAWLVLILALIILGAVAGGGSGGGGG